MTPRILLLYTDQAIGGVNTIANTLCLALRQQGWPIAELTLSQCNWRKRLTAAGQCDVILASHNFKPAYVAWLLGWLLHKPTVVWVHGPLQEVLTQARTSPIKQAWLRWLYRRVPQFVFVSRASRDSFDRFMRRPLTAQQAAVVIPNAVAWTDQPKSLAPQDPAPPTLQLAYVGRLCEEKQPGLLLDMLRLLPPQFRLTLLGDGPLRDALRQSGADLLAGGRLTLADPQAHDPHLYAPWDLTLLASRYEGCPMTVLESFATGVPCVGLPINALQELLGDDAPYLLARDHSAQALAEAVQAVCAMPQRQVQTDMARVLLRHQLKDFVHRWQAVLQGSVRPC